LNLCGPSGGAEDEDEDTEEMPMLPDLSGQHFETTLDSELRQGRQSEIDFDKAC